MSSTNRSEARKEHVADYYVTPVQDIELFLKHFQKINPLNWKNMIIADVCAGGNNEIRDEHGVKEVAHPMSYPAAIERIFGRGLDIRTYDIRSDSLADNKCDYLHTKLGYKPDVIFTNPPFKAALPIIQKALDDVSDNGYVIMLLRLNFFGSRERKPFFDEHMPEYCFVHHQRIGFTEKKNEQGYILFDKNGYPRKGSTDSIEYCHMIWRKGYNPDYTKLYII